MCGIAGYIGQSPLPQERINRALQQMRRRGPDDQSFYRHQTADGRHVALLHARLSIIDLEERSNQPMRFGPHVLAANGEIYNYIEARARLAPRTPPYETEGDIEVLLRALAADGLEGLDGLEGMWAFAWYNEATGTLVLSRDRFGEKPLHIWRRPEGVYFGSEVKFLAAMAGQWPEPDLQTIRRYLVNGYRSLFKNTPFFFKGIEQVPRAGALILDAAGQRTASYWTPNFAPSEQAMSFEEAAKTAREKLVRAVELRLRADVPLAFCLSGGVDSTALVAIAKHLFGADVHGYTIMNRDKRYEEREMVERTVAHLGIRHTPVPPETVGFLDKLDLLVAQHDAPVITQAYYAQWILLDHIHRDGYRIALSGSAADEIFSGYYDHHLFYLAAMRDDPARYPSALAEWQSTVLPEILNPGFKNPDRFVTNPLDRSHLYEDVPVFQGFLNTPFDEPFVEEGYSPIPLRNRMLNEMFHEAVPPILYQDDLNAMYFSIENRSPYLDRDLFEWSLTVPQRHLVKDGRAKALLRAAVADLAPHEVLFNPRKTGFNVPIRDLVDTADPATRARILADSPVWDLVNRTKVAAFLEKPALDNAESKFLFYLLSAKSFLEQPR